MPLAQREVVEPAMEVAQRELAIRELGMAVGAARGLLHGFRVAVLGDQLLDEFVQLAGFAGSHDLGRYCLGDGFG
ncbi:hypothetical protein D7X75_35365, partial [Corallococcus sp. CA031C]